MVRPRDPQDRRRGDPGVLDVVRELPGRRRFSDSMIPFGVSLKCSRISETSFASGTFAVPLVFTHTLSGSG
nr:unnamed protein product [Gemmataceae bacterium]